MSEGWFGLLGVVVGASITQAAAWWARRKRHYAYWAAMSAEVDLCKGYAASFLRDDLSAPLYRLPVIAYNEGFPALLGDGVVDHDSAQAVIRFYSMVQQMNRGLKLAQSARERDDAVALKQEAHRLVVKAMHLTDSSTKPDEGGPYYRRARAAIDAGMRRARLIPLTPYQ